MTGVAARRPKVPAGSAPEGPSILRHLRTRDSCCWMAASALLAPPLPAPLVPAAAPLARRPAWAELRTYCASYSLRKQALHGDLSRYLCCNGMCPCSGRMSESKCPEFCLCLEGPPSSTSAPVNPVRRSTYCASYSLRKQALHGDLSRYLCCNGMCPCSGRMSESKCPEFCLCLEGMYR
ncbi:hypothetical protein TSOC_005974 [Tetrabaena socialis]|uniref:Uncharacterized protein n=1 Tax=Tetrabaena socialis TaxID=47790 RepID=A0A2J8A4V4_9CHLO|nr:hypothetical protein TSOC_005974 [Tetrabaena socialis]|eukprot:PNH07550.1 hypothetical protein TSOC_005974 [Tetrabaena socialis]